MSSLRDEIRTILREEIAALRAEMSHTHAPAPERVHIANSADLTRFACDLLERAARDTGFAAAVTSGAQRFELTGGLPGHTAPATTLASRIVTGPNTAPARTKATELSNNLVTERDIEALDAAAKVLRVPKNSRLTPLANDEARRRGIRIERFAS